MKTISQIIILILLTLQVYNQGCYIENKKQLQNDFSNIWIGNTFQGTIGENNQRIEIRFISISKICDSTYSVIGKSKVNSNICDSTYSVIGKSKVNSNICDFSGKLVIQRSLMLNEKNQECNGPDYSAGYFEGKYELKENEAQSHVGIFSGDFTTMFDKSLNGYVVGNGLYGQEGISEFLGEWKDYKQDTPKYCSWGIQIPPTKRNDLFKQYDNEVYLFNSKYLDKGWKSYILSNLSSFTIVPKEFYTHNTRYSDDFYEYSKEAIENSIKIEKSEWWK